MTEPTDLYRLYNVNDTLLYVGISYSAIARMVQHKAEKPWFDQVVRIEIEKFLYRDGAAKAEERAIKYEKPLHNIQHSGSTKARQRNGQIQTENVRSFQERISRMCLVMPNIIAWDEMTASSRKYSPSEVREFHEACLLGLVDDEGKWVPSGWRPSVSNRQRNGVRVKVKRKTPNKLKDISAERRALDGMAKAIARRVHRDQGLTSRRELTHATKQAWRQLVALDDAISEAEAHGWIVPDGGYWRPGQSRPS
jgi:predicted GIY-YIG superfamily endonuclease